MFWIKTVAAALLLLLPALPAAAEPYAPVVPKGAHVKVPDQSAVDLPPYPGAKVYRLVPGVEGRLPALNLLSTDTPEQVAAYYAERLEGWNRQRAEDGWILREGSPSAEPPGRKPAVRILPADPDLEPLMEGVRSHIEVWYGGQ